jgi:hypothetical protein
VEGERCCRMHRAGYCNAWKHGGRSGEMLRLRRQVRELLRESKELVEKV